MLCSLGWSFSRRAEGSVYALIWSSNVRFFACRSFNCRRRPSLSPFVSAFFHVAVEPASMESRLASLDTNSKVIGSEQWSRFNMSHTSLGAVSNASRAKLSAYEMERSALKISSCSKASIRSKPVRAAASARRSLRRRRRCRRWSKLARRWTARRAFLGAFLAQRGRKR